MRRLVSILLCLSLSACAGAAVETPAPPRASAPAVDWEQIATSAGEERLGRLLTGDIVVGNPTLLDWASIDGQTLPDGSAKDAFCDALDTPQADNLFTELLAAGLNAIASRRGRGSMADETKAILGAVVTFSFATCPDWKPALLAVPTEPPPIVAPIPDFVPVLDLPSTAWRLPSPTAVTCLPDYQWCWQAELYAAEGCPNGTEMSISVTDANGDPLGVATSAGPPMTAATTTTFLFEAFDPTHQAQVYSVTCS